MLLGSININNSSTVFDMNIAQTNIHGVSLTGNNLPMTLTGPNSAEINYTMSEGILLEDPSSHILELAFSINKKESDKKINGEIRLYPSCGSMGVEFFNIEINYVKSDNSREQIKLIQIDMTGLLEAVNRVFTDDFRSMPTIYLLLSNTTLSVNKAEDPATVIDIASVMLETVS
jgi:hypothetical protein